jgi:hypothetical protein
MKSSENCVFKSNNDLFDYDGQFFEKSRKREPLSTYLRPGAIYKGTQSSDQNIYQVQVEIKDCDFRSLSGYLTIYNLTNEHSQLTTYFETDLIGEEGQTFVTGKWEADVEVDRKYWSTFPQFTPYACSFDKEGFQYSVPKDREFLFMRWKELFLVPDYKVTNIQGASFAGFYYIGCRPQSGKISGVYFHKNSNAFQEVLLEYSNESSHSSQAFR